MIIFFHAVSFVSGKVVRSFSKCSIPFIFLASLALTRVHAKHAGDGIFAWEMPILQLVSTAKGPSSREP
jgi:hypothetical protein